MTEFVKLDSFDRKLIARARASGSAAGADFEAVIRARGIEPLWTSTISQLRSALRIQPAIISNGREDGWIMPTHLATIGFYMLRVRSNFVEIRDVLAR